MFVEALASSICFLGFAACVSWAIGLIVFSPLNEVTLLFKVDNRFRISDMLILAAHLQIGIGIIIAVVPAWETEARVPAIALICALLSFWWWCGVRMLARAGIQYTWHRWLFLGLIMPIGYVVSLGLAAGVFAAPFSLGVVINAISEGDLTSLVYALIVLLVCGLGVIVFIACRRTSRHIVDQAREERARRDGIQFGAESRLSPASSVMWPTNAGASRKNVDGIWFGDIER